jgi:hypothetical protein
MNGKKSLQIKTNKWIFYRRFARFILA